MMISHERDQEQQAERDSRPVSTPIPIRERPRS